MRESILVELSKGMKQIRLWFRHAALAMESTTS
jgi:hypothetical protein